MSVASLRVAIRADASVRSGLGHVKRCLALGQALRQLGGQVLVVSRATDVEVASLVHAAGLEPVMLPSVDDVRSAFGAAAAEADQLLDADVTVRALLRFRPSWVVVDHYALAQTWHSAVRSGLGSSIGVIDDLADRPLQADWVLNQTMSADRSVYQHLSARPAHVLCGPRYALLDAEYARAPSCEVASEVGSIGIFMGGVDRSNLSLRALEACRAVARFEGPIEVASMSANPHLEELRAACRRWPATHLSLDAPSLAAFFARHGLQIGAGGSATWERCCLGAPMLLLLAAENQRTVIPSVVASGAAAGVEPLEATDVETIGRAVRALLQDPSRRRQLSEQGRSLVDGMGAQRAALSLAAPAVTVRRARGEDGPLMLTWRNAPATRAASFESQEISADEHSRWLARTLSDDRRLLLVGQVGDRAVGVIRFDLQADGWAEVSLYLDPGLHGLGLGMTMLAAGEAFAVATGAAATGFVARIRDGNLRSAEMFVASGYAPGEGDWRKRRERCTAGARPQ